MGLKLYFSAGMASAAATMFLLKRGSWAFTAALTGLATGERFGDAEVPPADCWAGAPAATAMAATANHASLFQIISVLLPAFFLPLPESILSRSAANNLAAARVRQTRLEGPARRRTHFLPRFPAPKRLPPLSARHEAYHQTPHTASDPWPWVAFWHLVAPCGTWWPGGPVSFEPAPCEEPRRYPPAPQFLSTRAPFCFILCRLHLCRRSFCESSVLHFLVCARRFFDHRFVSCRGANPRIHVPRNALAHDRSHARRPDARCLRRAERAQRFLHGCGQRRRVEVGRLRPHLESHV